SMTMTTQIEQLIRRFNLQAHPEGGYYTETHRCANQVIRPDDQAMRSASTAIYYLLCDRAYSAWHRIAADELWHFYAGESLLIHVLNSQGALHTHRLGNALNDDEANFQVLVPA